MKTIIALRSYGDYVILLNSIKNSRDKNFVILVSSHLKPLHDSILKNLDLNSKFKFINFDIDRGILPLFTNKYFFTKSNCKSMTSIKNYFRLSIVKQPVYLEQRKRSTIFNIITKLNTRYIHSGKKNIYDTYSEFFDSTINHFEYNLKKSDNIILFPDSRKKNKILKKTVINDISNLSGKIKIAKFGVYDNESNFISYSSFDELTNIIKNADFIISSDSLPAHLAEFYNKPHFILYNQKINFEWLTPFCKINSAYSTALKKDIYLEQLKKWIC